EAAPPTREALLAADASERLPLFEAQLRARLAQALRVQPALIDPRQPLSELGLDSLMAVELAHDLESGLGVGVPLTRILEGPSLAQLAVELLDQLSTTTVPPDNRPVAAAPSGVYPLSQGQRALWFLHQLAPESAAYTIARAFQ